MKPIRILAQVLAAVALLLASAGAQAASVTVSSDVTANTTWYQTNTYTLQTIIYVRNDATLTIEAGTVVKGATNGVTSRPGIPNLVAGLWVTRGSKLIAIGTPERPIIMTYEGDDVTNPSDVPNNTSGQWGGIVLCGRAVINSALFSAGQAANPKFERFEGTTADGPNGEHFFGGNDDNDNSGTLRYVSIRYPGSSFAAGKELNGLTMGAVGKGTSISYVEVLNSSDDGFEWWGGNVNTHHLVSAFCEDDDFDTDQGYRGTNQFWFGIKPPWQGSTDSRGFETDGDINQTITGEQPKSQWAVHNATLIGRGKAVVLFGGGVSWNSRDEAAPNVFNSVVAEFNTGVLIDDDGNSEFTSGQANLRNTIYDVTFGPSALNANANVLFTDVARANTVQAAGLGTINYTNLCSLNPTPQPGSPALSNVLPQGAGLTPTTYRGAFGTNDQWALRWTGLYDLGYLGGQFSGVVACNVAATVSITAGAPGSGSATISWSSQTGQTYQLVSKTSLTAATWTNEGAPIPGTGGVISVPISTAGGPKFYSVICN